MSLSEKLILEELSLWGSKLKSLKGLSIGELILIIRKQLKMSQRTLAKRARVPQAMISNLERSKKEPNLLTVRKILNALFCDLLIVPLLREPLENILLKQARKKAEKRIQYLSGSMNLEKQLPDSQLLEEMIRKETEELLQFSKLWEEDEFRVSGRV